MNRTPAPPWTLKQLGLIGAIAVLALIIRLYYVHTAIVDHPLRGDATQYFAYALNLVDHGVFSLQMTEAPPVPDSFRDPGYPTFLAMLVVTSGREQAFYLTTLNVQCILSALTVLIYSLLARRWLGLGPAIVVGLGLAFWPHAITLSGYVLSETLLGFLFALALWLLQLAFDRGSAWVGAFSGLAFGAAALTNATLLPLIPLAACVGIWRQKNYRKLWLTVLVCTVFPCLVWTARSANIATEATASDRVLMNLVQGSWPEFHSAWYSSLVHHDQASTITMDAIGAEYRVIREDRLAGLEAIGARMSSSPVRYFTWYLSKPLELWGWTIGIGMGDIYVFPTFNSPLSGRGPLKITTDVLFMANPFLILMAAFGVYAILSSELNRQPVLVLCVIAVVLITAVYAILQSDARYATPYRGIEWILVTAGTISCKRRFSSWRNKSANRPESTS